MTGVRKSLRRFAAALLLAVGREGAGGEGEQCGAGEQQGCCEAAEALAGTGHRLAL